MKHWLFGLCSIEWGGLYHNFFVDIKTADLNGDGIDDIMTSHCSDIRIFPGLIKRGQCIPASVWKPARVYRIRTDWNWGVNIVWSRISSNYGGSQLSKFCVARPLIQIHKNAPWQLLLLIGDRGNPQLQFQAITMVALLAPDERPSISRRR